MTLWGQENITSNLPDSLLMSEHNSPKNIQKNQSDSLDKFISFHKNQQDITTFIPDTFFYKTNYYTVSLNRIPYLYQNDSFLERNSYMYDYTLRNHIQRFRYIQIQNYKCQNYSILYPYPYLLTDAQAALGDYEFNFAKIKLRKNHLFGIKDTYIELDFIGQTGFWQEVVPDQTASNAMISIPIASSKLKLNYTMLDENNPSTQFLPAWQNGFVYRVAHRIQESIIKWETTWIDVGYKDKMEYLRNYYYLKKQKLSDHQILLHKALSRYNTSLELTYQLSLNKPVSADPTLYQYKTKGKHLFLLDSSFKALQNSLNIDTHVLTSDKKDYLYNQSLQYEFPDLTMGIAFLHASCPYDTYTIKSIYKTENIRYFKSANLQKSLSIDLFSKQKNQFPLNYKFSAGWKQYFTAQRDTSLSKDIEKTYNSPFSDIGLSYSLQHDIYTLQAHQDIAIQKYYKDLWEQPAIQYKTQVKLTRDMNYNNYLSLGMNIIGHSKYYSSHENSWLVGNSLLMDLWIEAQITNLFKIQLLLKNVGNNYLYGVQPNPRTLITTIHWFFIN